MIVTGALCWWNESPEDLDKCVRGLGFVCDRVVAFDGAYARYPGATTRSDPAQVDAIRKAAMAVGLECEIVQPDQLWRGQVEKRTHLLQAAAKGSDWIVTVDADHVITAVRDDTRTTLKRHFGDVLSVPYVTPVNPDRALKESAVGEWHENQTVEPVYIPHIWRALPGIRVERYHWWYSAIKNGQRFWLWGGDGSYKAADHQRIRRGYQVEHRTLFRTPEQIRASRAFLNDRETIVAQTGQEDDQPTLPRPAYVYDWVPDPREIPA